MRYSYPFVGYIPRLEIGVIDRKKYKSRNEYKLNQKKIRRSTPQIINRMI